MGRPKRADRLILTPHMLDYLVRCCTDPAYRMVKTDEAGQARIWMRQDVVLELIAMARFGKGLATINAKSPEAKSAVGRAAAMKRWARKPAENVPGSPERDATAKRIAGGPR